MSIPVACGLCLPVLVGAAVMCFSGAPSGRWGLHLLSAAFGLVLYLIVLTMRRSVPRPALLALASVFLIASTLHGAAIDGVARWHELGALRIHPSALFAPPLLVFAAATFQRDRLLACGVLGGVQVVHFLQPDAGQATAVALGALALVLAHATRALDLAFAASLAVPGLLTWLRADPLPPAPFVEDIVERAFALGPAAALAAVAALVLSVGSPHFASRSPAPSREVPAARAALSGYLGGALAAGYLGEFPIGLVGFGPSPVVGAFLGFAALERLASVGLEREPGAAREPPRTPQTDRRELRLAN